MKSRCGRSKEDRPCSLIVDANANASAKARAKE